MKGLPIMTLDGLHAAAIKKRSVIVPALHPWKKPRPAAFIMHLQGTVIRRLLNSGMYYYKRAENKGAKK